MMNKLIEMLIKDEEIQKIRKEWIELKKMKKEKGIVD